MARIHGIEVWLVALLAVGVGCSDNSNGGSAGMLGFGSAGVGGTAGAPLAGAAGTPLAGAAGVPAAGAGGAAGGAPVAGAGGAPVAGAGGAPVAGAAGEPMAGAAGEPMAGAAGEPIAGSAGEPVAGAAGGEPLDGDHCLAGITNFASDGPFTFKTETAGSVKLWVPDVPAGCKVPVTHLANGTGGTCGTYRTIHERFASHGFLATCYENPNTGAGDQGLEAFMTAVSMHPDLADMKFGSTGHSQGGQAAFTVLALTEQEFGPDAVYAGLAMEPASGFGTQPRGTSWQALYATIKSPMFMFSGTADILVSRGWVTSAFNALDGGIEAYHWSAAGATHIPTPNSETMEVGVPWFRWKLLGDPEACRAFKALRDGAGWSEVESQNEVACP